MQAVCKNQFFGMKLTIIDAYYFLLSDNPLTVSTQNDLRYMTGHFSAGLMFRDHNHLSALPFAHGPLLLGR